MSEDLGGPIPPETQEPWVFLSWARGLLETGGLQETQPFTQPFFALVAQKSSSERDALLMQGKEVFGYLLGTGRDELRQLAKANAKAAAAAEGVGAGLVAQDPPCWPEPVDGAALLETLRQTYVTYILLSEAAADALALFTLLTYCFQHFDVLPNLLLKSPVKRCGKTKVLEVAAGLVRRPLAASNVTAATLFRSIAAFEPTLLLDECDSFMTGKHSHNPSYTELKNIVNSGHTRATAYVLRLVGDDHEPHQFSTYCPKLLASIGDLQDTVEDRSIILGMRRKKKGEQVQRWRNKYLTLLEPLQRQGLRWGQDSGSLLAEADPKVPDELNDRAQDCWRPLLAIADAVGEAWPDRARRAARVLATDESEQTEIGLRLLHDLKGIFGLANTDRLTTEFLLRALTAVPEAPWATWHRGQPLTEMGLARLLSPFGIRSANQWQPGSGLVRKGYSRGDLQEAFDRYGGVPSPALHVLQAARPLGSSVSVDETDELQNFPQAARVASPSGLGAATTSGNDGRIPNPSGLAAEGPSQGGQRKVCPIRTPMKPGP